MQRIGVSSTGEEDVCSPECGAGVNEVGRRRNDELGGGAGGVVCMLLLL